MPNSELQSNLAEIRWRALSKWDNEGGALALGPQAAHVDLPDMTNAEQVHLRIRLIALENIILAILAEGSERQLQVAREMAESISPRPGFTQHPLTIQAAGHINDLLNRAGHFRTTQTS